MKYRISQNFRLINLYAVFLIVTIFFIGCSKKEDSLPQPQPPTNLTVTIASTTQANLNWSDNSGSESGFVIERKIGAGNYQVLVTTKQNAETYNDTGLSANTLYTYRVFAVNQDFTTGDFSNEANATTYGVPLLTTSEALLVTATRATIEGNISLEGGSSITERGFVWSTDPNPNISLTTKIIDSTVTNSFAGDITGLNWNTKYYVRSYAINDIGTGYGNETIFTTEDVLITTSAISGVTPITATSGGTIGDNAGTSVLSRGVVWSTDPNPNISLITKTIGNTGTGSFVSNMTELNWNTNYYVRAYATNDFGTSYGNEIVFTTDEVRITTSVSNDITSISATSGGIIGDNAETSVLSRGIVWSTSPEPDISLSTKTVDGSGAGNYTSDITDLKFKTNYYVRAYATNAFQTFYGNEVTFTTAEFTDLRDGRQYQTTVIGSQIWMAENFDYHTTADSWYYNNDSINYHTYGRLYTWNNAKTLAPEGWHLPSKAEINTLIDYLGGASVAGGYLKETGNDHWQSPNGNASNLTGFTALGGGTVDSAVIRVFNYINDLGSWWTSTAGTSSNQLGPLPVYFIMTYNGGVVEFYEDRWNTDGLSVRYIHD